MFAALYINVIRIHLSFFQVISSIQTQQRERKEEEEEKNAFAFHLNFKTKKDIYRGLHFVSIYNQLLLKMEVFIKMKTLISLQKYVSKIFD